MIHTIGAGWKLLSGNSEPTMKGSIPVSVVIACRNESKYVSHLLDSLSAQTYPMDQYEVIIIDDDSTDDSAEIIEHHLQHNRSNIRLIRMRENVGKKKCLEEGIAASRYDTLLFTDADCVHASKWIETMSSYWSTWHPLVLSAPVLYTDSDMVIEYFQYLDGLNNVAVTATGIANQRYYNANGANIMYSKSFFFDSGGYDTKYASGDDVNMIHHAALKDATRIRYALDRNAVVHTFPETSWNELYHQRKRWATKVKASLGNGSSWLQMTAFVISCWTIVLIITGLTSSIKILILGIGLFLVKFLIDYRYLSSVSRYFGTNVKPWKAFQASIVYIPYIIMMAIFATTGGSYEWKGVKRT